MQAKKTSIVFTGDIGFDRYMDKRWEDKNLLSKPVLDFFHSADHTVANVEGALIDAVDDGSRGVFFHSMSPAAACVLKDMHADIWSIGNNHTMDAGAEGVLSTKKIAAEMGSRTIGAGMNEVEASEPLYLDEAGGIGMFCVAYQAECIPATATEPGTFRWDDLDYIARRIAEIKAKCRWCIVVSHGGEEFAPMPNPYTRERYCKFLELGADVVVAHHPHVPENYELFDNGKAIFYSLGNFISAQSTEDTMIGALLDITFEKTTQPDGTVSIALQNPRLVPVVTQYEAAYRNIRVYLYRDYTDELGAAHGNFQLSRAYIEQVLTSSIDEEFLVLE